MKFIHALVIAFVAACITFWAVLLLLIHYAQPIMP